VWREEVEQRRGNSRWITKAESGQKIQLPTGWKGKKGSFGKEALGVLNRRLKKEQNGEDTAFTVWPRRELKGITISGHASLAVAIQIKNEMSTCQKSDLHFLKEARGGGEVEVNPRGERNDGGGGGGRRR